MPFVEAVRAKILADPEITSQLGVYDQGDGEGPSVFTGPRDILAKGPAIEIHLDGPGPVDESWDLRGETQMLTVSVVGQRDGSNRATRKIAQAVHWLFERKPLSVSGFTDPIVRASTPQGMTEDDWPRFDVTVAVSAFKED